MTDEPEVLARGSTRRVIDLAREGFVIETEWYWRMLDGMGWFGARLAVRDLLYPLAWLARDRFALDSIAIDPDGGGVSYVVAGRASGVRLDTGPDRLRVDRFVIGVNRTLAAAEVGHTFALAVPRRYELRGLLVPDSERALLVDDPWLLAPTNRSDWR